MRKQKTALVGPANETNEQRLARLAKEIKVGHEAVMSGLRTTLEAARRVGAALLEAKQLTPHGDWGMWLEAMPFSQASAGNYMRIARRWGSIDQATATVKDAVASLRVRTRPLKEPTKKPVQEPVKEPTTEPTTTEPELVQILLKLRRLTAPAGDTLEAEDIGPVEQQLITALMGVHRITASFGDMVAFLAAIGYTANQWAALRGERPPV